MRGTKCEFKNAQLSSFTSSERESLGSKNEYLAATGFADDSLERERGKRKADDESAILLKRYVF